jgi:hypothetical protein
MPGIQLPQNPGIGGLNELTSAEEALVQSLSALGDPGADRILFWDESSGADGAYQFLTVGSGLSISGTTLSNTAGALSGTINEIAYFDSATTIASLAVATYPSLTQLSYVKGVTSAIQTQIDTKLASASYTAADVLSKLLTVDGSGSGLDADLLDGNSSAAFALVGQTFYIGTTQVAINRASAALTLAGITLTTPDIGTPSAGVLTNATGLPAASVVAGILGVTGTRMTKLWATDIESTNAPTVGGVVVPTISSTNTITNKRIEPRIVSAASYTTDTGTSLDVSTTDLFVITAQAGALLFNSPGGTPVQGQKLMIRIKDNATARALTWNAVFRAMGTALPSTTVLSKTLYLGFIYNSTDTKWDLVASAQET